MNIGPYSLPNNVLVAPMAGITDAPFRRLCLRLGAGYAVSEMAASDPGLLRSARTSRRVASMPTRPGAGADSVHAVQIVGADAVAMADAARFNVDRGAQVIDINMGCPARKVCRVAAGSALMADEPLALAIIERVARAVPVPVTVKMRTGPSPTNRNAVNLARGAEAAGAAMITVHGRTRACGFRGQAEYDTIAEVKLALRVPVIANGDIDSPERAREVLARTGADGVMIGRAAFGRPWLFREIAYFLATGRALPAPTLDERFATIRAHLREHVEFHGEAVGPRIARKHVGWYLAGDAGAREFLRAFNRLESAAEQLDALAAHFDAMGGVGRGGSPAANDQRYQRSHAA